MKLKRVKLLLSYLSYLLIILLVIISSYHKNYIAIFWGAVALFIMLLPSLLKRKWKISLPWTLNFLIFLSLFLHLAGHTFGFYSLTYSFYDKIGHLIGSISIALLGFTSVLIIDEYTEVELTNKSIIFFVIIFTLAVGAFWEIGEFTIDSLFKTNAQYDGLEGTMLDLIFDFVGGTIAGVVAYFKLKKGKQRFIDRLLKRMKLNFKSK